MRRHAAASLALSLSLLGATASADEPVGEVASLGPATAPGTWPGAQPVTASPQPLASPWTASWDAYDAVTTEPEGAPRVDRERFRGGAATMLGGYFAVEGDGVPIWGLVGRLGSQFSDRIGLYAMPSISGHRGGMARFAVSCIVEATPVDGVFLGGGPTLGGMIPLELWDNRTLRGSHIDQGGMIVGLASRAGVGFGGDGRKHRHAFSISAELHADYFPGLDEVGLMPTLTVGYDAY